MEAMGGPTVMIVEDDPGTAAMFELMLSRAGYRTVVVHGGSMAINALMRERPDVLLLDIMMPGVSGLEICRYVRREPDFMDLPVLMVTAKSLPDDLQAGMDAGATLYLVKPVSKSQLVEAVEQVLNPGGGAR